jgi:hypothetical protein
VSRLASVDVSLAVKRGARSKRETLRISIFCARLGLLAWPTPFLRGVLLLPRFHHPLGRASASFGACSQTNALQCQDSFSQAIPFLPEFRKDLVYVHSMALEYHVGIILFVEGLYSGLERSAVRQLLHPRL